MNCPKCGTTVNPGAKFCGSCGNDLSSVTQNPVEEQNVPSTNQMPTEQEQMNVNMVQYDPTFTTNESVPGQNPSPVAPVQPVVNNQPSPTNKPKGSKTALIVGIIAVLVVIAAIIGIVALLPKSEEQKEKEVINDLFDPNKLIKIKNGDKYGYINSKGKLVLEANYESATDFYGDYAIVRAEVEIEGLKTTAYQVIDKNGNVKKQAKVSIKYISEKQMWLIDNELYNSSMKKISPADVKVDEADEGYFVWVNSKENTGGIMNDKGKQTYTYQFQSGENYIDIEPSETDESLKETYCRVNIENDKYAIVNCDTGVVVHDFTTSYISVSDDNVFKICKENSYSTEFIIYIQGNKEAFKTNDPSNVRLTHYPGYVEIRDGSKPYDSGRYTYLHLDTLEIKDEKPQTASDDDDEDTNEWEKYTNNKSVSCSDGYGLTNGETFTLPCEWDSLKYVEINLYKYLKDNKKDYIYAKKDDKWYLVDLSTKKGIVEFNTSYIYPEEETTFMYYTDKETNNKKVFNILTSKSLNVPKDTSLYIYSNYVTVKDTTNKTLKYYNTDLELIYTESL